MTTFPEVREALEHLDSFTDPLCAEFEDASKRARGLSSYFAPNMLAHIDAQAAEIERLREALRGLRHAGALLSNIAFNLAQHPGRAISSDEAADMGRCRKAWDEAARAALEQTK